MRLLYDTNIVFDVIERRMPHYSASLQMHKLAQRGAVEGALASHTIANIFYQYQKAVIPDLRNRFLIDFEIVCGNADAVRTSLNRGFRDLEDALQVAAAVAWKAAFIITRNERDFKLSPIPALSPSAYLKRFH
ncbi:MAG TPA: PIN domain-containing protein [Verrucomicrobiae bacterium]|nr:PIN domain-containing protein [Verrucomicrobiae bacterium]